MPLRLITLFLFCCSSIFAQQPALKDFEVDSAAQPRGGMPFLLAFLQTNLRKPVAMEAEGMSGRVIVTGVVEPDGRVSEVSTLKGIHPDLDREAVRVFSLYRAWKPAMKDKKAVRQQVTIPVSFARNAPFTYRNGAKLTYFDADSKLVADSSQAQYRQSTPINAEGLPSGDIVIHERKGKSWKEVNRLPLVQKDKSYQTVIGKQVRLLGYQNANLSWENLRVELNEDGNRVREAYYKNGERVGEELTYYPNGMVSQKKAPIEGKEVVTFWYPSGQIKQIGTGPNGQDQVMTFWDSTGRQLVDEGNGQLTLVERRKSYADTSAYTTFTEQGGYKDGLKHGDWAGQYADGSYSYEEKYVDGVLKEGQNKTGRAPAVRYTVLEQHPEFPGGMLGLGKFLSENLQYPPEAQKAGAEGKVFISFVVCTDGTLCDYEVLKGVRPDIDREALRVVKKMSGRWTPGVQRGQKVRVKYNLPINFSLY